MSQPAIAISQKSLDAVTRRIQRIQTLFQEQLAKGQFDNAALIVQQCAQLLPHHPLSDTMLSTMLLVQGKFQEAKEHTTKSLSRFPHHFDLLYNLAWLYEQQGELVDAYYMYSRAEYAAVEEEHIADVKQARQRLKEHRIPMKFNFGDDAFTITVPRKDAATRITYSVPTLLARKHFFDVVLSHLHPTTSKVLEIECGEGTIARNLASLGLQVVGIDSNSDMISRAIILDMFTRLRVPGDTQQLRFSPNTITPENSASLEEQYDAIVYSPKSDTVSATSQDDLVKLLTNVMAIAGMHLFIALPETQPEEQEKFAKALRRVVNTNNVSYTELRADFERYTRIFVIDTTAGPITNKQSTFVPQGLQIVSSRSEIVDVELSTCRDLQGFGYVRPHWHPFVAQIEQYTFNEDITYNESILRDFFHAFQPQNQYERYFGRQGKQSPPLHKGWAPLPWFNVKTKHIPLKPFQTRQGGNHFHGPNTEDFGTSELNRIITAYKLLKKNGYQPEIYPDGYIQGFFLKKGDDYRFVITEGQHRIAALAALGYRTVRCRMAPDSHYPRCVNIADIAQWPLVKQRMYSTVLANRMFHIFFAADNTKRLREWGLNVVDNGAF